MSNGHRHALLLAAASVACAACSPPYDPVQDGSDAGDPLCVYYPYECTDAGSVDSGRTYDAGTGATYDAGVPETGADASAADAATPGSTCALDGGASAAAQPVASGQASPGILTLNATSVFWVDFAPPYATVMAAPIDGSTPPYPLNFAVGSPRGIAADATHVYWTDFEGGTVQSAPVTGGPAVSLATGQNQPIGVAVDATNAYWTTAAGGAVMKAPLAGGTPVVLASGQGEPGPIAIDATNVYWTNLSGEVMQTPLAGGTPIVLARLQSPVDVAVDATSVYWLSYGPANGQGSVAKVPIGGGEVVALTSPTIPDPEHLALDGANVYFTAGDHYVESVPLTGGIATYLSIPGCGGDDPFGVAVDGASLYWSNSTTGTVMRLAKR